MSRIASKALFTHNTNIYDTYTCVEVNLAKRARKLLLSSHINDQPWAFRITIIRSRAT